MKTRVILNPRAAAGSAGRRLPELERALRHEGIEHELVVTEYPGHATELARTARDEGIERIAIVGGDGTINEVSQAYVDNHGQPAAGPALSLIGMGTGGDFRKSFGLGTDMSQAVRALGEATERPLDLGVVELTAHDGSSIYRAFLNITSFGISGLVDRIVNQSPKWMGGKAAFFLGSLRATLVYSNAPVRVTLDGQAWYQGPILTVAIANGQYFGGGMKVAPQADPSDGWFDVVAMTDMSKLRGAALSRKLYDGSHIGEPDVLSERARSVNAQAVSSEHEVLIDLDGETPGRLPLTATIHPAALRIYV